MGKISVTDVLDAVEPIVNTSTVEAIRLTLWPTNQDLTNVTIKDAPVELEDNPIITALSHHGRLLHGSIRRGKIPKTNIMAGTIYLSLLDVTEPIPIDVQLGSFSIRVFCDNEKTVTT